MYLDVYTGIIGQLTYICSFYLYDFYGTYFNKLKYVDVVRPTAAHMGVVSFLMASSRLELTLRVPRGKP